jgi:hypothetical protein
MSGIYIPTVVHFKRNFHKFACKYHLFNLVNGNPVTYVLNKTGFKDKNQGLLNLPAMLVRRRFQQTFPALLETSTSTKALHIHVHI